MREKFLILLFLLVAVAIWGSSFSGRLNTCVGAFQRTSSDLGTQAMWLGRRAQIEADAKKAISRLDPAQTLDGTKLLAEINRIASENGLNSNVTVDDNRDERTAQFAVHSLRFTARRADYATLIRFYQAVQKRSPYIGIEQFALGLDNPSSAQLSASFRFSSVEVLP